MSTLPVFHKTWDFAKLNQRIAYTSLLDTASSLMFGVKDYLVATMGASQLWSCDGTAGPTSAADATDRNTSKAKFQVRGATEIAAQSWSVIEWAGVQFLLSYQGTTDDMFRMSFSQGSLFRPASAAATFVFTAATTDICTSVAHGQVTGAGPFQATTSTALPAGLAVTTNYWLIVLGVDTFKLATSYANALAGSAIDITTTGTGVQTLTNPGPTRQPAASDEVLISAGITVSGATTSGDRVYSIEASSDRSIFRCWVFRAGAMISSFGLEEIDEAPGIASGTVFGWNSPAYSTLYLATQAGSHGGGAGTTPGASGGFGAWLGGASRPLYGGTVMFGASLATMATTVPELNGGPPIWPLFLCCNVIGCCGWLGTRIDGFLNFTAPSTANTPPQGVVTDDVAANTRILLVGSMATPWSTTAGLVTA